REHELHVRVRAGRLRERGEARSAQLQADEGGGQLRAAHDLHHVLRTRRADGTGRLLLCHIGVSVLPAEAAQGCCAEGLRRTLAEEVSRPSPQVASGFRVREDGRMADITFRGTPVQTSGELPAVGGAAPGFTLVGADLSDVTAEGLSGSRVVLNILPSVDTGVCATSVRTFNERAA